MKNVAIAIHSYKETLKDHERISLQQLNKVLSPYPKYFFAPKGSYPEYAKGNNSSVINFKKEYFLYPYGYNQLLCSREFYDKFKDFEYILICHLDVFVFSDQLEFWLEKKYDYIGAPWTFELSEYLYIRRLLPFIYRYKCLKIIRDILGESFLVGNGGFSLRKVETFLKVIDEHQIKFKQFESQEESFRQKGIFTAVNEDNFWALYVPTFYKKFRVAPFKEALQFSFEADPLLCYEMNKHRLPFGCHAWHKHGIDFWRPFIRQYGYEI